MPAAVTAETKFEPEYFWAKIPHGIWLREATSVAVDSEDRVYVFNRGNMPVLVFNRDGNLVHKWGNDTPWAGVSEITDPYGNPMKKFAGCCYTWAHSVRVDHEDNVWLVDTVGNQIFKTDRQGNPLHDHRFGRAARRGRAARCSTGPPTSRSTRKRVRSSSPTGTGTRASTG